MHKTKNTTKKASKKSVQNLKIEICKKQSNNLKIKNRMDILKIPYTLLLPSASCLVVFVYYSLFPIFSHNTSRPIENKPQERIVKISLDFDFSYTKKLR